MVPHTKGDGRDMTDLSNGELYFLKHYNEAVGRINAASGLFAESLETHAAFTSCAKKMRAAADYCAATGEKSDELLEWARFAEARAAQGSQVIAAWLQRAKQLDLAKIFWCITAPKSIN